jgi:hypothetical protein
MILSASGQTRTDARYKKSNGSTVLSAHASAEGAMRVGVRGMDLILSRSRRYINDLHPTGMLVSRRSCGDPRGISG